MQKLNKSSNLFLKVRSFSYSERGSQFLFLLGKISSNFEVAWSVGLKEKYLNGKEVCCLTVISSFICQKEGNPHESALLPCKCFSEEKSMLVQ